LEDSDDDDEKAEKKKKKKEKEAAEAKVMTIDHWTHRPKPEVIVF